MSHVSLSDASILFAQRRHKIRRRMLSGNRVGGEIVDHNGRPHVAALQSIDVHLEPGSKVGLIGHNGSGKTTLLRTIAGVYTPSSGTADVHGRISTLFSNAVALSDFDTGRANLELAGLLNGLSVRQVRESLEAAIELSGLSEYVDDPLISYSEGMKTRLGFAMAALAQPDILLIDEILTAADWDFLRTIKTSIPALQSDDHILVIASHSRDLLRQFCTEIIELERGRIKRRGPIEQVLNEVAADQASSEAVKP